MSLFSPLCVAHAIYVCNCYILMYLNIILQIDRWFDATNMRIILLMKLNQLYNLYNIEHFQIFCTT